MVEGKKGRKVFFCNGGESGFLRHVGLCTFYFYIHHFLFDVYVTNGIDENVRFSMERCD